MNFLKHTIIKKGKLKKQIGWLLQTKNKRAGDQFARKAGRNRRSEKKIRKLQLRTENLQRKWKHL